MPASRRTHPAPGRPDMPAVRVLLALLCAAPAVAGPPAGSPTQLVVYPPTVALTGPRDGQRLIVLGVWPDGRKWDLTRDATFASSQPKTATVGKDGVVRPVGDGSGALTVRAA